MSESNIRDDLLISICLSGYAAESDDALRMRELASLMEANFHYWELLITVDSELTTNFDGILRAVPTMRILKVRPGTSLYRQRVAMALEAIGDIVVLGAIDELSQLNILTMIETADLNGSLVMGQRDTASPIDPLLSALGRNAGFHVSARDMQTIALPRTILNLLLAHADRQLALRFAPANEGISVQRQNSHSRPARRSFAQSGRRVRLVHRLLVSSAPRVLAAITIGALILTFGAIMFAIYSCVVWLTFAYVQPGWFTTSLALSSTAAFLGIAIFGIAIGIQNLLETVTRDVQDDIVSETTSVNLFAKVLDELNVEVSTDQRLRHTGASAEPLDPKR